MFSLKARWAVATGVAVVLLVGATVYTNLEKKVTIKEADNIVEVSTFAQNVKELLDSQNIELESEDVVMPSSDTKLRDGMRIVIKRAFPVKINTDGNQKVIKPNLIR